MKTIIAGAIYGAICSVVLPKIGIQPSSFEYWGILFGGSAIIGLV